MTKITNASGREVKTPICVSQPRSILRAICANVARARGFQAAASLAGTTASRPAVDLAPHQRDGALIDRSRIPCLDRREIGLARLIAGAGAPAMGLEEDRRRIQRIGGVIEIAGAIGQDVLG